MLKSYISTFFRILFQNKIYYAINIIGFSLGLLCWIFLNLWFEYEKETKQNNENSEKLIKIGRDTKEHTQLYFVNGSTQERILYPESPMPLSKLLINKCPDIKFVARFGYDGTQKVIYKSAVYEERRFAFADPEILKIFRFKYIKGNHQTAFEKPNSIIINQTTAARFFLSEDALGKKIELVDGAVFEVSAVIEDIPDQYKFKFDFMANINHIELAYKNKWSYDNVNTYALINNNKSLAELENRINKITSQYDCGILRVGNIPTLSQYENIIAYNDSMEKDPMNFIFSIIILFILLTAIINYANNSTVLSSKRALEVGMRKVFGATKSHIALQYIVESLILSLFCLLISILLTWWLLPFLNEFTGLALKINLTFEYLIQLIIVALTAGMIAGVYPAFFMSGFKPISILKGDFRSGPRGEVFRKIFVVFQFSVSVTLIVSSFVVFEQYELIENKKLANENEYKIDIENNENIDFSNIQTALVKNKNILYVETNTDKITITIVSVEIRKTVEFIRGIWEKYSPEKEFNYSFQDKGFNKIFHINDMKSKLLYFFTIVIVFVSYLGLFGNSAFMVKQKIGEIALRKAFGARFIDIQRIMSGEYIKLVFVSNIIAFFFVIWPMNTWFRRFSYRINISYEAFLYTLIITMALTIITIGYHSIKAWLTNPAKNLMRE